MGLGYFNICFYLKNLTCWYRGTSFQVEIIKDPPQREGVLAELGTGMVLVTMAARIVQSMMSLLQKRALYWKSQPHSCMIEAIQEAIEMETIQEGIEMGAVPEAAEMGAVPEAAEMGAVPEAAEMGAAREAAEMGAAREAAEMGAAREAAGMDIRCEQMGSMANREAFVPSCRNPFIRSMICVPSKHLDSLESDEESEGSSDEDFEEDCSKEDVSGDSGLQVSWTPKSKSKENRGEESDWSDDDAWGKEGEESNVCDNDYDEDDDLWASFCHDDPYNPLCFVMPTRSSQPKKEAPTKKLDTNLVVNNLDLTKDVKTDCDSDTEKQKTTLCKKPVLSGYKKPHKCPVPDEEARQGGGQGTKRVRFSPKVTVHHLVTWSFAHRMARKGQWEQVGRDNDRFQKRIAEIESAIGFCLRPRHRVKIWARLQTQQNCEPLVE